MMLDGIPTNAATLPTAQPLLLKGGPRGALLLHGFTGTPRDFGDLGPHLHAAGFTVSVPRLPGHGTNGLDFARTGWRDWMRASLDAWLDLRGRCETVHVVGHSMGGVLAALLSSRLPVGRLVLLAPAFQYTNKLLRLSWLLAPFVERIAWEVTAELGITDPDYATLSREYWRWRYPRQGVEYLRLRRHALRALPKITANTLIVLAGADKNVPAAVGPFVESRMTSARTQRREYPGASHLLLNGREAARIRDDVGAWLLSIG